MGVVLKQRYRLSNYLICQTYSMMKWLSNSNFILHVYSLFILHIDIHLLNLPIVHMETKSK